MWRPMWRPMWSPLWSHLWKSLLETYVVLGGWGWQVRATNMIYGDIDAIAARLVRPIHVIFPILRSRGLENLFFWIYFSGFLFLN